MNHLRVPLIILIFSLWLWGLVTVCFASNFMSMWLGLEINALSFCLILTQYPKQYSPSLHSIIKYFTMSTVSGLIFLSTILLNFMYPTILVVASLVVLVKLGVAPLHSWMIPMVKNLSYPSILMLLTWQKLSPLIILSQLSSTIQLSWWVMMTSLWGAMASYNLLNLKHLLVYSSIAHMGWMLSSVDHSVWMFSTYYTGYLFIMHCLVFPLLLITMSSMPFMGMIETSLGWLIFFLFLTLAGLPPFLGFFMKVSVVQGLLYQQQLFMISVLLLSSLLILFAYLNASHYTFMITSDRLKAPLIYIWIHYTFIILVSPLLFLFIQ